MLLKLIRLSFYPILKAHAGIHEKFIIKKMKQQEYALISQGLFAQPAILQDSSLNIPQGAALVNGEVGYFNDIQLVGDDEGNFTILSAQPANLVAVNTVLVNIVEAPAVQVSVTVSGNKSVPCIELQAPGVIIEGSVLNVVIAETSLGPAESCIAVLEPFETTFALNVEGLAAGTYTVNVNGVEAILHL